MRCNICYMDIIDEDTEIKCPRCINSFHKDHLAAWLLSEKSCPVCREELSHVFRDELKPRDERDRERLWRVSQNLQSLGDTLGKWESRNKKKKKVRKVKVERDEREKVPLSKKLIPALIFIAWMVVLLIIFGDF